MTYPTTNDRGEPDRIWLQVHGDCHEDEIDGARVDLTSEAVTWCCERVLDLDVMYVRADLVDDMQREAGVLVADIQAENARLRELLKESRSLFNLGIEYAECTIMVGKGEAIRDAQVITKAIDAALKGA